MENEKVVIIDDLIATGGTAEAAAKIIEMSGGIVSNFIFVINLFDLGGCNKLIKKGYKVENLLEFPSLTNSLKNDLFPRIDEKIPINLIL